MENDQITNLLMVVLGVFIVILVILTVIYIILTLKNRKRDKKIENSEVELPHTSKKTEKKNNTGLDSESIMNFMEFEDITDNMIVQKKGRKYLMVIECQGVNYDLMSEVEKAGVEEGFIQFLNTLRHPIQIYVQTRSINLEKSIQVYEDKIKAIEEKYIYMKNQYENMLDNREQYTQEDIQKFFFEFTKIKNLYEYGKDIIEDTKKMSLNKNILNRLYYIIVPYYPADVENGEFDKDELESMAFSELYTRCQSIMRTLTACGINSKILTSIELVELLYMAYNRDGAEVFGVERALQADYDQLYSTAPDVLEKKMTALNNKIEELAVERAKNQVSQAKKEIEEEIKEKENNMDELIDLMAKMILQHNKEYVGEDVAEKAIENIDKEAKEKGEKKDVRKKRKTSRNEKE